MSGRILTSTVITNGLIYYVDFANITSFVSGSTVIYDLTKRNSTTNLVNIPTYSNNNYGVMIFNGVDEYMLTPTINNFRTISIWINYYNTGVGWKYLLDARPGMSLGWYSPLGIGSQWAGQYVNGVSTTVSFSNITNNTWTNLVLISDAQYSSTINFMSRFSNNEYAGGSISNVMIYNKILTQEEITQNYNALKGRFGL